MVFILVGVTGGIAAYKAVQLVRLLVLDGHDVHVVPTEDALRFVGLPTWEAISRHPVTTSVHEDVASVRHVSLGQAADLVIVAPATANTLAKMAAGLADDLLGTTLLATKAPVVVAPAMHTEMWRHAATTANIATLRARGVHVVGPADGALTGGDSGPGRMSEPDAIVAGAYAAAASARARGDLAGLRVAVSAGGTREPIDPVRYIGNRSSGKQGVAVALAAADRGADVLLVAAYVDSGVLAQAAAHPAIGIVSAGTAAELATAMAQVARERDVVVMAAAVADYRVDSVSDRKLSKESAPRQPGGPGEGGGSASALTLELVETEDILARLVTERHPGQTIVGFAAETPADADDLVERGRRKRARKGVDLLAVNAVGWSAGFEQDDNTLVLIDAEGRVAGQPSGTKRQVSDALWDAILAVRGAAGPGV